MEREGLPGEVVQPGAAIAPHLPLAVGNDATATSPDGAAPSLHRYYAYKLMSAVDLAGGIWILYLRHRGLSLTEIGLAESCFHLAPITLELPTGSLADILGRKWSLAIGSLLVAISALLLLAAHSLWLVLPAMYLNGASYAFRSGADQAFLYDALAERAGTDPFARILGRLLSVSYLVIAASTWLGATLAGRDFTWPYVLTAAIGLAGAYLASGLREPVRDRAAHRGLLRTIAEALRIIRGQPGLAALLGFAAGLWTLLTLIGLYAQAVLADQGLATSRIGLVIGSSLLCTATGSWFAHRLTARGGFPAWTIAVTAAIVAGGLGLGSGVLALGVAAYLLAELAAGLYEPLLSTRVNDGVAAAQRATILSVEGFLFSATMIWAFPLTGWVADHGGWLLAYAAAGSVVVLLLLGWLALDRART